MRYAVDYRNMYTAIHGLIVFDSKVKADATHEALKYVDSMEEHDYGSLLEFTLNQLANEVIEEIHYRDIVNEIWSNGDESISVVNSPAIDLYGI